MPLIPIYLVSIDPDKELTGVKLRFTDLLDVKIRNQNLMGIRLGFISSEMAVNLDD